MLCEKPIYAIYRNGKREFLSREKSRNIKPFDNETMMIDFYDERTPIKKVAVQKYPCRKCLMCRWEISDEWALRCKLEAKESENNRFITLTYEQKGADNVELTKIAFRRFMDNLRAHFRRKHGIRGIRFFGCGEYGKKNLRPHYHIILFNCPSFGDEEFYKRDKSGYPLYKSERLEHLWGKGFCSIGGVSDQSIEYVTRSIVKSYFIKPPKDCKPAFVLMSKQNGIGKGYLIEHFDEIVNSDCVIYDGKKYPIPSSFNRTIKEKIGTDEYRKRLANPRQERAKSLIESKAYENGITTDEVIFRRRKQVEAYIKKLILHDEETQI